MYKKIACRYLQILTALVLVFTVFTGIETAYAQEGGQIAVTIQADGRSDIMRVPAGTVRDALRFARIAIGDNDRTEPPLDSQVSEFAPIRVIRREVEFYTVDKPIAFERVYVFNPELRPGDEVIEVYGRNGFQTATYARFIFNGVVEEERLVEQVITQQPISERVQMGFQMRPISPFNFNAEFNARGEPIGAIAVHRSQVTTAYTAPPGARTATGRIAQLGYVAVNPNVIPYGSRLFIQSADGSFVYGYAIAADTGSSLLRGNVDIDLFFETHAECIQFGVRRLDVFVLPPATE